MKRFFALFIVLAIAGGAVAQTATHDVQINLTAFQRIRVSDPGTAAEISLQAPGTIGAKYEVSGTATKDLFYTVLNVAGGDAYIDVNIDNDLPSILTLTATVDAGTGGFGDNGVDGSESVALDAAGDTFIDNIKSCWTGVGDPPEVTYTLTVGDADPGTTLDAAVGYITRTVTYTIAAP